MKIVKSAMRDGSSWGTLTVAISRTYVLTLKWFGMSQLSLLTYYSVPSGM